MQTVVVEKIGILGGSFKKKIRFGRVGNWMAWSGSKSMLKAVGVTGTRKEESKAGHGFEGGSIRAQEPLGYHRKIVRDQGGKETNSGD